MHSQGSGIDNAMNDREKPLPLTPINLAESPRSTLTSLPVPPLASDPPGTFFRTMVKNSCCRCDRRHYD